MLIVEYLSSVHVTIPWSSMLGMFPIDLLLLLNVYWAANFELFIIQRPLCVRVCVCVCGMDGKISFYR